MGVAQRSMSPTSENSPCAAGVDSISRLRRVAASRMIASSRRSRVRPRMWGAAARCVSLTYCRRQPAAPTAVGAPSAPKPARSRVPNCLHRERSAASGSKCQDGRSLMPSKSRSHAGREASSASSNSAGLNRSNSPRKASSSASSAMAKRPLAMSSQASPTAADRFTPGCADRACPAAPERDRLTATKCEARLAVQQGVVRQRPRRDDAHDFPGHRPLARPGIADLLADGHGLAQPHEPAQVVVHRADRNAGHGDGFAAGLPAAGQRDVHQLGGAAGVIEKELVEIPHSVEEQHIGMPGLDAQVLLHHGGVGFVQYSAVRGASPASPRDRRGGFVGKRTL